MCGSWDVVKILCGCGCTREAQSTGSLFFFFQAEDGIRDVGSDVCSSDIGVEYAGTVFAIAESPKEAGVIWAGTNDGYVQITRDGGKNWTNVTKNIPSLPEWGTVSNIEASRYDAGTAYITVDFHQMNNRDPFAYKTGDYGKTWTAITNGIPHSMLSYAHCIREDPVRKGQLYLGTEIGRAHV